MFLRPRSTRTIHWSKLLEVSRYIPKKNSLSNRITALRNRSMQTLWKKYNIIDESAVAHEYCESSDGHLCGLIS